MCRPSLPSCVRGGPCPRTLWLQACPRRDCVNMGSEREDAGMRMPSADRAMSVLSSSGTN